MRYFFILFALLSGAVLVQGQTPDRKAAPAAPAVTVVASPAYAELILRKTELLSDIESYLVSYTEDFPKLKEARYELSLIEGSLKRILAVSKASETKLTEALGKLLVRKAAVDTDYWALSGKFKKDHPEVLRAKRKAEIFENAVKEVMP